MAGLELAPATTGTLPVPPGRPIPVHLATRTTAPDGQTLSWLLQHSPIPVQDGVCPYRPAVSARPSVFIRLPLLERTTAGRGPRSTAPGALGPCCGSSTSYCCDAGGPAVPLLNRLRRVGSRLSAGPSPADLRWRHGEEHRRGPHGMAEATFHNVINMHSGRHGAG